MRTQINNKGEAKKTELTKCMRSKVSVLQFRGSINSTPLLTLSVLLETLDGGLGVVELTNPNYY